ncbi:MAG: 5-formyltetrahydrofolate cyclo-ligase [Oscillospiraceae bacterium]
MDDPARIAPGAYGIPEPVDDGPEADDPAALVLMPGLAFDPQGHRLGYGGGFYDRFLAAEPHPTIALCYAFQLLPRLETGRTTSPWTRCSPRPYSHKEGIACISMPSVKPTERAGSSGQRSAPAPLRAARRKTKRWPSCRATCGASCTGPESLPGTSPSRRARPSKAACTPRTPIPTCCSRPTVPR